MNTTGASACLSCPVGFVQLQTGQSKCEECLAGSYRGTTDNADEACVPCAPGYYQEDAGQGQCFPCIPSSFNAVPGRSEPCSSCAKNTFSNTPNATSCNACGIGETAEKGSAKCSRCGAGRYGSGCESCIKGRYRQSKKDDEWTFTITTQDITAIAGVAVTQTVSGLVVTGTLKTALTGADIETIVVAATTGGSFIATTDIVIGNGGSAITIAHSTITNAGKITPTDPTTCVGCPKGYYQGDKGQASCLPCIPGEYNDAIAQTTVRTLHF